jgi:hypothetical protein
MPIRLLTQIGARRAIDGSAGLRQLNVRRANGAQLVEAITTGLACGSVLWWVGSSLVGIFRPDDLAIPYWSGLPHLRTDTSGFIAFIVAVVCITSSEYLRLRRRHEEGRKAYEARHLGNTDNQVLSGNPIAFMFQAFCRAVALMSTGIVVYLSLNTVTHPATQYMTATHLLSWPTEGTLRIVALICCVIAVAILRFLRARHIS